MILTLHFQSGTLKCTGSPDGAEVTVLIQSYYTGACISTTLKINGEAIPCPDGADVRIGIPGATRAIDEAMRAEQERAKEAMIRPVPMKHQISTSPFCWPGAAGYDDADDGA